MSTSPRPPRSRGRRPGGGRPGGKKPSGPPAEPLQPTEDPPEIDSFRELDLGEEIHQALEDMGITKPTPIQALAIGPVLEGKDIIAKAETGTGKTLAFGAPMMARIDPGRSSVLGLILCPTRELTEQVFKVVEALGEKRGIRVVLIVGGEEMGPQVKALHGGAQVVVGTPGRVLDLMNQKFLSFPWTEYVILDEADKMLEIGFIDDVEKILKATAEERQTLLFSATFPPALLSLARRYTRDPVEVATASGVATVDTIDQYHIQVTETERPRALAYLIKNSEPDDVFLVFCDRRTDVDRLFRRMERERFSVKALHGGYDQAARFRVMGAFRTGEVKALLATDVASRGLDVEHVTHVINVGVPRDVSDYTHRIGRTGRAGRKGTAITLVAPVDERKWRSLVSGVPWTIEEYDPQTKRGVGERPKDRPREDREERPRGRPREDREERPRGRAREEREERPRGRAREEREERPQGRAREEREERPQGRAREEREERPQGRAREEREERPQGRAREEREERPQGRAREGREERPQGRAREGREERPQGRAREEREERPRGPAREEREERPQGRAREGREERPQGRAREGREERPRGRTREERPERPQSGRTREERPNRDSRTERGGDSKGSSFGLGLESSAPARKEKQREKPRAAEPQRKADEAPKKQRPPEKPAGGGFGAGL